MQHLVCHLGLFEGGGSLLAIESALPPESLDGADLIDVLFNLVEASLVTVVDGDDGEPRFDLLLTVQRFAIDQLTSAGQYEAASARHAQHFYTVAVHTRERQDEDYPGCRAIWARDLSNIRIATRRGLSRVQDASYPGSVPELHTLVLLIGRAAVFNCYQDAARWMMQARTCEPADTSDRCALVALAGASVNLALFADGDQEACLERAEETWALYQAVLREPLPEQLTLWIDPHRAVIATAAFAISALCEAARPGDTTVWVTRLQDLEPHLSGWLHGILPEARAQIAHAARDYEGARANLLESQRIFEGAGIPNLGRTRGLGGA